MLSSLQNEKFSLSLHPNNKSERYARRKSPKNCARRTEEKVNPSTVSKWCTNSSQPDIETLAKISKLLDVSVEELFNKKFMESVSKIEK